MSLKNYYKIHSSNIEGNEANYFITLNSHHEMFNGHFPEFPLLPGVVQVELIHELMELSFNKKLTLNESKNIKYLKMINPTEDNELQIKLQWKQDENIKLKASIISPDESKGIMMKFSANYSI